jgi:hypothetical protein
MPTPELAKPIQHTGGITSGSILHTSAGEFTLKVISCQVQFGVNIADITGATDVVAKFEHNGLTTGQFQVSGYAVGGDPIQLANLQSFTNNDGNQESDATSLTLNYGANRSIVGTIVLENIALSFNRTSAYVGLTMSGRYTSVEFGGSGLEP